ncbi:MAG: FAD-dependent oxidoreductase [Syntrophomonadaceae bacterium]
MMQEKTQTALVVGGGLAGMEATIRIARAGYQVVLVEKQADLGGVTGQLYSSFPRWEDPQRLLQNKLEQIERCDRIHIHTSTEVRAVVQVDGAFDVILKRQPGSVERQLRADAAVLATGFELFDASIYGEYGYGIYPNVIDSLEFEARLRQWGEGRTDEPLPQSVAFIKCVGSRDRSKGYPYCSKICCMYTAKQAGLVKDLLPQAQAYVFYMDYRAAGKDYEEFTRAVIEDRHVRYVRGRPSKVLPENGRLIVRAEDTLMGVPIEVEADLIVLAAAVVPSQGTRDMAAMFGVPTDQYGFMEGDPFKPGQSGERVFFAGACGFAVETQGAQYQGAAAAAGVLALFAQD